MFKKHLYDNVMNMVGFADRNRTMHFEEDDENKNQTLDIPASSAHKQSDIYSDAPFIALPFDKLPSSKIVNNDQMSNTEKAWSLWAKYIATGSEFEINVAGQLREYYRVMFADKQKWLTQTSRTMDIGALADIFDACNSVNMGFMSHSFARFKHSDEWENVVRAIITKQSIDVDPDYIQ